MGKNKGAEGRRVLSLWGLGVVELAMFLPVWLVAAIYAVPGSGLRTVWLLTLPVLTLCGVLLSFRITKLWIRWLAAAVPGLLHMLPFHDSVVHGVLLFAASWTAVVRGMYVSSPESRAKAVLRYAVGLAIYLAGYTVVRLLAEWRPYLPLLTIAGTICLVIALFTVNRRMLQQETLSADEHAAAAVPGLRRHNRMFVLAVTVGAITVTATMSGALGHWLWLLLRALLRALLPGDQPQPEPEPPPQPTNPMQLLPAAEEKGWFGHLLDILFYTFGAAAVGVLGFLLVRTLYRNRRVIAGFVRRVLNRIAAWLGRSQRPDAGTGYVDEETTIFSWESVQGELARKWRQRFGGGRRPERWNELRDNRERVRFLYRRWLRGLANRGYTVRSTLTPEEICQEAQNWVETTGGAKGLVDLYYKARYGSGGITDQEVERVGGSIEPVR